MTAWEKGWRRWLLHLIFWTLVVASYALSAYSRDSSQMQKFFFGLICMMPFDIFIVYFNAYFLVPRLLLNNRIWAFTLSFLGFAGIMLFLQRLVAYYIVMPELYPKGLEKPFWYFPEFLFSAILTYSFVFLFAGVRLFKAWLIDQKKRKELETQSLQSELALLRSQVNPHFLFNTLNNIDTLVFKDQQKASDAIVRLSEIMRYMLYEANTEMVPLSREIEYLQSMVDLLRLRLKDPGFIRFSISGEAGGKLVPPMLLVPFIENAYKHGKKQGKGQGIAIDLRLENDRLWFHCINPVDGIAKTTKDQIGGIGLQNVRRRLDLIYGSNYQLDIRQTSDQFEVKLVLPL